MGNRMGVKVVVALLLFGGLALILYSSMGLRQVTGEVCISYGGRTECRVASGMNRDEVLRTAADMACATLASGMANRISCQNSEPTRVTWQD